VTESHVEVFDSTVTESKAGGLDSTVAESHLMFTFQLGRKVTLMFLVQL
jgi:hypothetical protein